MQAYFLPSVILKKSAWGEKATNIIFILFADNDNWFSTDANDVIFTPADMTINFVASGATTFSVTIDANNDNDFEGLHSFVISLPTDSGYIVPLDSDTASTTVTISDFDGEINHSSQIIMYISQNRIIMLYDIIIIVTLINIQMLL